MQLLLAIDMNAYVKTLPQNKEILHHGGGLSNSAAPHPAQRM
jgi:hypothetical protein